MPRAIPVATRNSGTEYSAAPAAMVAEVEPEEEVRARHILVETEEEAQAAAERIAAAVAERYFKDYPGIVYMDQVEVLRPEKF